MLKNYLTYPTKTMSITQNYLNDFSHNVNATGNPKDFPIDEAGANYEREYFYCPCDKIKVVRIYGVGGSGTNTIWLESVEKVYTPTFIDYVTIMIIHPNDDTLRGINIGQTFNRGDKMFLEGNDGNATGYHFHISVAQGKYTSPGWIKNSRGAWVLSGNTVKPEDVWYIDESFTKVKNTAGLNFRYLPKAEYELGNYVCNYVMRVRTGPGIEYRQKEKSELTVDGQRNANIYGCYLKGTVFTALEILYSNDLSIWAKTPSGYVCLKDEKKYYCKKQ